MTHERIRAIIIDDEMESGELLSSLLKKHPTVQVIDVLQDPNEGIKAIESYRPDMLFLDIRMPQKDGFQVLDQLRKMPDVEPEIVFTTAYDEFALKAFEYSAFAYLLKPIDPDRLDEVIRRFKKNNKHLFAQRAELLLSSIKKVVIKTQRGIIFLDPKEIFYCEADGNYTKVHFGSHRKELVSLNLGILEQKLVEFGFFRVSRSCLINLEWIKLVDKRNCIIEKEGETFSCNITRDKANELLVMMSGG